MPESPVGGKQTREGAVTSFCPKMSQFPSWNCGADHKAEHQLSREVDSWPRIEVGDKVTNQQPLGFPQGD
jgi:hypothetical protein